MKKITTNAETVRVIGNLIPDFDEVTSNNYFIYRNVTHTKAGSLKHLGKDRLIRKMVGSRVNTTLYLEPHTTYTPNEYLFYVQLTSDGFIEMPDVFVRLTYADTGQYIGLVNLTSTGEPNVSAYSDGSSDIITVTRTGNIPIKAEFEGYEIFHSSETTVNIYIEPPMIEWGENTANPWTTDVVNRGSLDLGRIYVNYTNTPCEIKGIPLTGDFKLELYMSVDVQGAYCKFGLSTAQTSVSPILTIDNTHISDTTVTNIFPTRFQLEKVAIMRTGNVYKINHGDDTVTKEISHTGTVYVYMEKTGNGSLVLHSLRYLNG